MPRTARPHRAARLGRFRPRASRLAPNASPRSGLTLIEMLMATAITLVMMAAVVSLFANVSGSIRNRRAIIELSGQLRQVRHRLARDLAGCTVPRNAEGLVPWQRPGEAIGYFEFVEGGWSDANPSQLVDGIDDPSSKNFEIDYGATQIPGSQLANVDPGVASDARALGDYDDILALTVRSESEPFVARVGNNRVESTLAEVVWYALENPADDPNTFRDERILDDPQTPNVDESETRQGPIREPGMRTLYRRVLLIAPWLGPWQYDSGDPTRGRPRNISVHLENPQADNNPDNDVWVANTLADLTRREYRWAHVMDYSRNTLPQDDLGFPHAFNHSILLNPKIVPPDELIDPEYLMLNDVLAWDVRAFDPGAPLYAVSGGVVVSPNDPGWLAPAKGTLSSSLAGYGAYADLGWGWDQSLSGVNKLVYARTPLPSTVPIPPYFNDPRRVGWHPGFPKLSASGEVYINEYNGYPAVFDTWTWHYESDGRDQYGNAIDTTGDGILDRHIDDAVDGIDDDGVNGVDDPGERETWPPYNVPLRGVRVILRTYEFDTRQIREASVTSSFVP